VCCNFVYFDFNASDDVLNDEDNNKSNNYDNKLIGNLKEQWGTNERNVSAKLHCGSNNDEDDSNSNHNGNNISDSEVKMTKIKRWQTYKEHYVTVI
jgi:hypothetical protein